MKGFAELILAVGKIWKIVRILLQNVAVAQWLSASNIFRQLC